MNQPENLYDIFLSHASADKPWVRTLCTALEARGLRVFLDEKYLEAGGNFVLDLSGALGQSRFMVLVLTHTSIERPWVRQEWSAFMAEQGPLVGQLIPVLREPVELPTILKPTQALDAQDGDAERAAEKLAGLIGRLEAGDARRRYIGQHLSFTLTQESDEPLRIIGPDGTAREVTPPWQKDSGFGIAYLLFQKLAAKALELHNPADQAERAELHRHARTLGTSLFALLFDSNALTHLERALIPGAAPPLVTLRSDQDRLLTLPWELLYRDGSFLIRDAKLDLSRTTAGPVDLDSLPAEPASHFKLVVNVSAPEGSGLSYEAESYRITRALTAQCELTPTELGTVDDLVETLQRLEPTGIHFSGHGSPAALLFEDDEGRNDIVAIAELIQRLRKRLSGPLPPFFYLASCHGNEPGQLDPNTAEASSASSAAELHRAGVAQVVGYFGPIADELSTRAEEALYRAIAEGQSTRYAIRQARVALSKDFDEHDPHYRPGEATREDSAALSVGSQAASSHPFAWAQLVYYHRGPDFPLSLPSDPQQRPRSQALQRTFRDAGNRRLLATGFIGRRTEMHRARRRIREGERVFVFQGLGGLGKSTLALEVLKLLGQHPDLCTLWCQDTENEANPAEALTGQLLGYCRNRFGPDWEGVVQQVDQRAGENAAVRFNDFLQALLQNVPNLVLYLDNLESLLIGPTDPQLERQPQAFGTWRSPALAQIWQQSAQRAQDSDRLYLVASCRYDNDDFQHTLLPVSPLPNDALFRRMAWFPALNRLSILARARLVAKLAGHPRAVEYTNDLIQHALSRWQRRRGEWRMPVYPDQAPLETEWQQLVEPALPQVRDRLEENLLLGAIWERVLDDRARRMLYRMTLLRGAWDWELMRQLGEPNEPETQTETTAERLQGTSLLEPVERLTATPEGAMQRLREYTLHPATARYVTARVGDDAEQRLVTHHRVGAYLEERAKTSPDIETVIEAGYHLFQAGEYDQAEELLSSASGWLQNRGRVREGLQWLAPFLDEPILPTLARERAGRVLGTVGLAYHRLSQVEKAIGYYEQALDIFREIGDRQGEGADLGNLGSAYYRLGQVDKAIGYYEQGLVIDREIGDRRGEGAALGNLGSAYADLGQVDKAIGLLEQARRIGQEIKDPNMVRIVSGHLERLRQGSSGGA